MYRGDPSIRVGRPTRKKTPKEQAGFALILIGSAGLVIAFAIMAAKVVFG